MIREDSQICYSIYSIFPDRRLAITFSQNHIFILKVAARFNSNRCFPVVTFGPSQWAFMFLPVTQLLDATHDVKHLAHNSFKLNFEFNLVFSRYMSLTDTLPFKKILVRIVFGNTRTNPGMQSWRSFIERRTLPGIVRRRFFRLSCLRINTLPSFLLRWGYLLITWSVEITLSVSPCFSRRLPRSLSCSRIEIHRTFSIRSIGMYTIGDNLRLYNWATV